MTREILLVLFKIVDSRWSGPKINYLENKSQTLSGQNNKQKIDNFYQNNKL